MTLVPKLFIMSLMLALSGCAGFPMMNPLNVNSPAMQCNGFSFTPPQNSGWEFSKSENEARFYLLVETRHQVSDPSMLEPQTLVIGIETRKADRHDIATLEGLMRYTGRYITTISPERRQRLLDHSTTPYQAQGTECVRYSGSVEEQPRKLLLDMQLNGFVCRHPHAPDHVVRGGYSERHAQGGAVKALEQEMREAETVLKSVTFTPVK